MDVHVHKAGNRVTPSAVHHAAPASRQFLAYRSDPAILDADVRRHYPLRGDVGDTEIFQQDGAHADHLLPTLAPLLMACPVPISVPRITLPPFITQRTLL